MRTIMCSETEGWQALRQASDQALFATFSASISKSSSASF
jgi:hypothetical protein